MPASISGKVLPVIPRLSLYLGLISISEPWTFESPRITISASSEVVYKSTSGGRAAEGLADDELVLEELVVVAAMLEVVAALAAAVALCVASHCWISCRIRAMYMCAGRASLWRMRRLAERSEIMLADRVAQKVVIAEIIPLLRA